MKYLRICVLGIFISIVIFICGCGKKKIKNDIEMEHVGRNEALKKSAAASAGAKTSSAEAKNDPGSEEIGEHPVFELKNWDSDYKAPEVDDDRSNIRTEKRLPEKQPDSDKDNEKEKDSPLLECPAGSMVYGIADEKTRIFWKPKWHFEGTGAVKLVAFCLSPDKSALFVVEQSGKLDGPNSSRIVVINTYTWEVAAIHEIPKKKIKFLTFIPDLNLLCASSEKQPLLKEPAELFTADIRKGSIKILESPMKEEFSDIMGFKRGILLKTVTGKPWKILFYSPESQEQDRTVSIESMNRSGIFAYDPKKNFFALAGDSCIEIFKDDFSPAAEKIATGLEENFIPENALFAGDDDAFVVSSFGKPTYLFRASSKKILSEISGKSMASAPESFIFEEYKNNRLVFYSTIDFQEKDSFIPSKVKPHTSGHALFISYLDHHGKYLVIDAQGTFSLYFKKGKSWKKTVLLSAREKLE